MRNQEDSMGFWVGSSQQGGAHLEGVEDILSLENPKILKNKVGYKQDQQFPLPSKKRAILTIPANSL